MVKGWSPVCPLQAPWLKSELKPPIQIINLRVPEGGYLKRTPHTAIWVWLRRGKNRQVLVPTFPLTRIPTHFGIPGFYEPMPVWRHFGSILEFRFFGCHSPIFVTSQLSRPRWPTDHRVVACLHATPKARVGFRRFLGPNGRWILVFRWPTPPFL